MSVDRDPAEPILQLRDVYKSFGEAEIICGVSLDLRRAERHAVIGPNGAGKSTLFHLVSGRYTPSRGDILLEGRSIAGLPPHVINRRGWRDRSRSPASSRASPSSRTSAWR